MPPRRRGRPTRASRNAVSQVSTPQRDTREESDAEMVDAPAEEDDQPRNADASADATPAPAADDNDDDDDAQEAAVEEEEDDQVSDAPVIQSIPRRRRGPGRPRASRSGVDSPGPDDDGSDSGTPRKRRGGFRGGFRGRPRWGPKTVPDRHPIDKMGTYVDVINDEADLPEDPAGEQKVDKDGNLSGGRDYRVRVFKIMGRDKRLYMLSTEPARCTGFRDSYLFFNKHLALHKVVLNDDEKMDLIDRDVLPHSYKGRSIGVVTARSVFREFGARIIIGGKKVIDDYEEAAARARGDTEGEIADPSDRLPPEGQPYNKNQYVAWHGASSVYHNNTQPAVGATMPTVGKRLEGKKRTNLTIQNWQFEHASDASKFNASLTAARRANASGVYDTHTNLMLYPQIMQPTHAKWSSIPSSTSTTSDPTLFSQPSDLIKRNFMIADSIMLSAPSGCPPGLVPGPPSSSSTSFPISAQPALSDVPASVRAELPPDCLAAFDAAVTAEREWRNTWRGETSSADGGLRADLRIGYARFPLNL